MAKDLVDNKGSYGIAAVAFGAWALILLVAFFSYRGSDIGQLPNLMGNLGGGPLLGGAGLLDCIAGIFIAALIVLSWFGLGNFVSRFIVRPQHENQSRLLEVSIDTAVGAAIWSLIWFFLGLLGAYSFAAAILSVVAGFAFLLLRIRSAGIKSDETGRAAKPSGFDWALIALIAFPVILALIAALAPPTAKDTLLYHFALPKVYIAQGSNAIVEGNMASYLALGAEMHNVWAILLGGFFSQRAAEAAAGATSFAFFPILLLGIYGWARELNIERRNALVAVLMVAAVPTAYHVAANAYIDVALALFITLATYFLSRWWKALDNGSLVYIAIFLGAAISIKLTSVVAVAAFALIVLLRAREAKENGGNIGKVFAGGFAALILAGVIASPWYLRTWKETGSPVFPFYMSVWKGKAPNWDVERSNLFQAMNSQYGGIEKTPLDYLLAPWNLSVAAQPEYAVSFDGVVGTAFLCGFPLLIWALWKFDLPVEVKISTAVAGILFLFWLFSSQQLRYLLPVFPLLAIAIVVAVEAVSSRTDGIRSVAQLALAGSAAAGILVTAAWFLQTAALRVVLGGESRDEYLTRNIDYFPYYRLLNTETAPDAKVWLINMRRDTYNLNRPYFSDYLFEDWTLRKMIWESRNVQELKAKTAAMGVKYVLTRHDFLFDYDTSTIVDDKKPRSENEAKLKIAKEFILDESNTVRADERFSLIKVF